MAAHVLSEVDLVLVMTVNQGFGGQAYIRSVEPKIVELRPLIDESGYRIELEVDGGTTTQTILGAATSGADVFISGSWLYDCANGKAAGVRELRTSADRATRSRVREGGLN